MNTTRRRLVYFIDFDSTCTRMDLATQIPLLRSGGCLPEWHQISARFSSRYSTILNQQLLRTDQELNYSVEKFMEPFAQLEYSGVNETEDASCLANIQHRALIDFAEQRDILRPGLDQFLSNTKKEGSSFVNVISANWSYTVVQRVLEKASDEYRYVFTTMNNGVPDHQSLVCEKAIVPVYTNDLLFDERNVTTGKFFVKQVVSSEEKMGCMIRRINELQNTCKMSPVSTVFIGDSLHDLLCLTKANVGIVMSDDKTGKVSSSLRKVCEHMDIQLLDLVTSENILKARLNLEQTLSSKNKQLFVTNSWSEVISAFSNEICDQFTKYV